MRRWRDHGYAKELHEPAGHAGSDLAVRLIQDVAVKVNHSIDIANDEIALCERQMFTEIFEDETWVRCDLEKVQGDLMLLGGFLFDLSEDVVMLISRASGESVLDQDRCSELASTADSMKVRLDSLRVKLGGSLQTLSALNSTRMANLNEAAGRRRRRLEVIVGIFAAIAIVPGLAFSVAQVSQQGGTTVLVATFAALFGTMLVALLLIRLILKGIPFEDSLDEDPGVKLGQRDRRRSVTDRLKNVEWDPEWPPRRAD